jgi:vanillate O-demethylase ferredoxin subunit
MTETTSSTQLPNPSDTEFEVILDSTGASYQIPPDKTILAVLLEAGVETLYDCQRGECGVCQVGVVEGVPDHRDSILSESERAAGRVMQICVSRSKTPRLVIDL